MSDRILALLSSLGLPGVFAGVFLEAVGLPFPGSALVALAGFLAKQGVFAIRTVWLVSLLGYLLGSLSAFLIGRHLGGDFITRWQKFTGLTPERLGRAQQLLQRSAPVYVIGGRFIPALGNITPYVAGLSGISAGKFLICDMIHAILWLTAFLGAGAALGSNWPRLADSPWLKWAAIGGGILIGVYVFGKLLSVRDRNPYS